MRFHLFYHSLVSDWNHGNAHFLRGVVSELLSQGHEVRVFEPKDGWSRSNLLKDVGPSAINAFHLHYPKLKSIDYDPDHACPADLLCGADVAIVHEWNSPRLVEELGRYRQRNPHLQLLFHDTHHRAVTAPEEMARFDLSTYDAVLAYGASLRDEYVRRHWHAKVFVWHEAADTRVFRPMPHREKTHDVVWIGNWGDDERAAELEEFLIEPMASLGLRARVYGVRYPPEALRMLQWANIEYRGFIPNFEVPFAFSAARVTIHVPRRPYASRLKGIPTIRPFEAMACGIPLLSAPWSDTEHLFSEGADYLVAPDGAEMRKLLRQVLRESKLSERLSKNGLRTIQTKHSCAHRVVQLLEICESLKVPECEAVAI
jgi:spore maturation protein CgeB